MPAVTTPTPSKFVSPLVFGLWKPATPPSLGNLLHTNPQKTCSANRGPSLPQTSGYAPVASKRTDARTLKLVCATVRQARLRRGAAKDPSVDAWWHAIQ